MTDALATTVANERDAVTAGDADHLTRGQAIDRYVILELLGAGGMGRVYAAYDPDLDRRVAIKLVRGDVGPSLEPRLQREAQAMARLDHPNVIRVHDVGVHDGQVFMAMELIDGATLRRWLEQPARRWREVLATVVAAGRGLAAAHAAGIVHRDFKPENVLVARDGRVVVTDFGIARVEHAPDRDDPGGQPGTAEVASTERPAASLTRTGSILGTPAYMAPEQHLGHRADARADQFSFCVVLYQALYGAAPFRAEGGPDVSDTVALAVEVVHGRAHAPPPGTAAPGWLAPIVMRGLAADPAARWPSMAALLEAIAAVPRRRRRRVVAGGIAIVGGAVVAAVALRPAPAATASPCASVDGRLTGAWDDATRAAARTAMLAIERPLAATTWPLVQDRLDRYAAAWRLQARAICEQRARRPARDEAATRRDRCLDHRLRSLAALASALTVVDAAGLDRAVAATSALPELAVCDQPDLIGRFQIPPGAVADAAAIDRVEATVARARALIQLGQYPAAIAATDAIAREADALRYPALAADVAVVAALARASRGDGDAVDRLAAAANAADAAAHDEARFEALKAEADALLKAKLHDLARVAIRAGYAALARVGAVRPRWESAIRDTEAQLALQTDDQATALRLRLEALAWAERVTPRDEVALGRAHTNLGGLYAQTRDFAKADAELALGRELLERGLGADHPRLAQLLTLEGALAQQRKDYTRARELTSRAVAHSRRTVGADSVDLLGPLYNLVVVDLELERYDDALREAEEGLALATRAYGEDSQANARWLSSLAAVHTNAGRVDAAVEPAERALALLRAAAAPGTDIAYAAFVAGRARWLARRDPARARQLVAEALALNRAGGPSYAASVDVIERWRVAHGMAGP